MSLIRTSQETLMKSLNYGQQTLLPFDSVIGLSSILPQLRFFLPLLSGEPFCLITADHPSLFRGPNPIHMPCS